MIAVRYRDEILPRTTRAYTLMVKQYGLMDASYSRVLSLQEDLSRTEVMYLRTLESMQLRRIALDGFLYSGGLDMANNRATRSLDSEPEIAPFDSNLPYDLNAPNVTQSIFASGLDR